MDRQVTEVEYVAVLPTVSNMKVALIGIYSLLGLIWSIYVSVVMNSVLVMGLQTLTFGLILGFLIGQRRGR